MHKGFLATASLLGALSVALGAFAAHRLKELVSEKAVSIFETAVRYQFYHVFALFLVAVLYQQFSNSLTVWAGRMFITGIVLFSGSLYGLAIVEGMVKPGFKWLGPITPVGGLCFIIGWVLLAVAILKRA